MAMPQCDVVVLATTRAGALLERNTKLYALPPGDTSTRTGTMPYRVRYWVDVPSLLVFSGCNDNVSRTSRRSMNLFT